MTRALILAAGRGSRLEGLTDHNPKGLVELKSRSLVSRSINAMKQAGVQDIAIVTGYHGNLFEKFRLKTFSNNQWETTNMVSSLVCADDWLSEGKTIVCYSDIFFSPEILSELLSAPGDIVVAADLEWEKLWRRRSQDFLSDAESFRSIEGKLTDIGRQPVELEEIDAQYMGLISLTSKGWADIKEYLLSIGREDTAKISMTELLMNLIKRKHSIDVCLVNGQWGEVDTPSDLKLYEKMSDDGEFGEWFYI